MDVRRRARVVNAAGERTLRISLPLTIPADDDEQALAILEDILA